MFAHKRRTAEGRTSESKRIPAAVKGKLVQKGGGVFFRVTLTKPDGELVQSRRLFLGAGAAESELQRAVRNAIFGTLRKDTDYDAIGEVEVSDEGELVIDGDEWGVLFEPEELDEPLLDDFLAHADELDE